MNKKMVISIFILVAIATSVALYFLPSYDSLIAERKYNNIEVSELDTLLQDGTYRQYLDVRTNVEYDAGHIDGFVNLNLYNVQKDLSLLDQLDKNEPVVVICKAGGRSAKMAALLSKNGFKKVYNVMGGVDEWNQMKGE